MADLDRTTTSIVVDDTSKLPVLGLGQYFVIKLVQDNTEVLKCTTVVGNTLTVIRGFYTSAFTFRKGALCVISIDPYGYELETSGGSSGLAQPQVLARVSIGF